MPGDGVRFASARGRGDKAPLPCKYRKQRISGCGQRGMGGVITSFSLVSTEKTAAFSLETSCFSFFFLMELCMNIDENDDHGQQFRQYGQ